MLALKEPGAPTILYNEEYTMLSFRGRNLSLPRLQTGLNNMIQDTWDRLLAFTDGRKIKVEFPPLMSEDVRSTAVGYTFIDHITTDPPTLPLLFEMSGHSRLPLLRPNGHAGDEATFEVDPGASEEFFHKVKPIIETIAFLVHATSSGPLRLSEVVEDRHRNGTSKRSLFVAFGKVFFLRTILKTSTLRGHRSSVVHFPSEKVSELLLYYLVVIRPIEVFLTASLGWESEHTAYSQFLYVVKGRRLSPRGLSSIIADHTDQYFKCKLTGSQLRHVLISIQAVFLPPILDPSVQKIGDSQAGHSSAVANNVYGQRTDFLPGVDAAMYTTAEGWCKNVHSLLGLGPEGPTRPIPHLLAPPKPTSWDPPLGYAPPHPHSPHEITAQLHHALNSGLSHITQQLAIHCEKVVKEAVLQGMTNGFASTGFPLPVATGSHSPAEPLAPAEASPQSPNFFTLLKPCLKQSVEPACEQLSSDHPQAVSDDDLLQVLSLYTKQSGSTFTSPNQQRLLRAALEGLHDGVIAILPTGSGKSVAIFGPVLAESSGISVVITCYTALRCQLAEQARSFGIKHLVWSDRNRDGAPDRTTVRLVIMITDDMDTQEAQM